MGGGGAGKGPLAEGVPDGGHGNGRPPCRKDSIQTRSGDETSVTW